MELVDGWWMVDGGWWMDGDFELGARAVALVEVSHPGCSHSGLRL